MIEDTRINLYSDDRTVIIERIKRILNNYDEIYSISISIEGDATEGENKIIECD